MPCTVSDYFCTVGSSWASVSFSDISSCNSTSAVVPLNFSCIFDSTTSAVLAVPSSSVNDFFSLSLIFFGIVLFLLFSFISVRVFKR